MKKLFLMAMISLAAVSANASLPVPKTIIIKDVQAIEDLLAFDHNELEDPSCIRKYLLESSILQSKIATGEIVKSLSVSYFFYNGGDPGVQVTAYNQNGKYMDVAVCDLK
ncbi:MAG: hypothetical protein ACOYL6_16205 [Bacteriovoracaceae bacterium]